MTNIQKILLLISLNTAVIPLVFLHEQPLDTEQVDSEVSWEIPKIPQRKFNNVKLTLWGGDSFQQNTTSSSSRSRNNSRSRNKRNRNKLNLVAIIKQGKQNYVLFTNKKKEINKYNIGDSLPNNSKLLKIKDDFVEVMRDDKVELMYLYPQKK
ncbi:hypothetical protein QUF74_15525 [Candidatus Halobeggiatoa sp. HSG11]|nr:hypothetical protein [Candidatus Halobeggiatoa sp. HSG11]